jgi:hypothetical protein
MHGANMKGSYLFKRSVLARNMRLYQQCLRASAEERLAFNYGSIVLVVNDEHNRTIIVVL